MTNLAETFSCLAASRHAVRAYKPDPVPSSILDAILADATSAPSWSNTRPFALGYAQPHAPINDFHAPRRPVRLIQSR